MNEPAKFNPGDKVTSKWSSSGAVWVVESIGAVSSNPDYGRKLDLRHPFRDMTKTEYEADLRAARDKDIERVEAKSKPKVDALREAQAKAWDEGRWAYATEQNPYRDE